MDSVNKENEIPREDQSSFASFFEECAPDISLLKNLPEGIDTKNENNLVGNRKLRFGPSITDMQNEMEKLRNENYNMRLHIYHLEQKKDDSVNAEMSDYIKKLVTQNEQMRKAIDDKDYLNRCASTAIDELKSEIERLKHALGLAQQQNVEFVKLKEEDKIRRQQLESLLEQNVRLEADLEETHKELARARYELDTRVTGDEADPMNKLINDLREAHKNIERLGDENKKLSSQLEKAKLDSSTDFEGEIEEGSKSAQCAEIKSLQNLLDKQSKEILAIKNEIDFKEREEELSALVEIIQSKDKEIGNLRSSLDQFDSDLSFTVKLETSFGHDLEAEFLKKENQIAVVDLQLQKLDAEIQVSRSSDESSSSSSTYVKHLRERLVNREQHLADLMRKVKFTEKRLESIKENKPTEDSTVEVDVPTCGDKKNVGDATNSAFCLNFEELLSRKPTQFGDHSPLNDEDLSEKEQSVIFPGFGQISFSQMLNNNQIDDILQGEKSVVFPGSMTSAWHISERDMDLSSTSLAHDANVWPPALHHGNSANNISCSISNQAPPDSTPIKNQPPPLVGYKKGGKNHPDLRKRECSADRSRAFVGGNQTENKSSEIEFLNAKLSKSARALCAAFDKINDQKKIIDELRKMNGENSIVLKRYQEECQMTLQNELAKYQEDSRSNFMGERAELEISHQAQLSQLNLRITTLEELLDSKEKQLIIIRKQVTDHTEREVALQQQVTQLEIEKKDWDVKIHNLETSMDENRLKYLDKLTELSKQLNEEKEIAMEEQEGHFNKQKKELENRIQTLETLLEDNLREYEMQRNNFNEKINNLENSLAEYKVKYENKLAETRQQLNEEKEDALKDQEATFVEKMNDLRSKIESLEKMIEDSQIEYEEKLSETRQQLNEEKENALKEHEASFEKVNYLQSKIETLEKTIGDSQIEYEEKLVQSIQRLKDEKKNAIKEQEVRFEEQKDFLEVKIQDLESSFEQNQLNFDEKLSELRDDLTVEKENALKEQEEQYQEQINEMEEKIHNLEKSLSENRMENEEKENMCSPTSDSRSSCDNVDNAGDQNISAATYSTGSTWPIDQLRSFRLALSNLLKQLSHVQVLQTTFEQSIDHSLDSFLETSMRYRSVHGDRSQLNMSDLDTSRPAPIFSRYLLETSILSASGIPPTPCRALESQVGNITMDQNFNEAALEELKHQIEAIHAAINLCSQAGNEVCEQINNNMLESLDPDRQRKQSANDEVTDIDDDELSEITSYKSNRDAASRMTISEGNYSEILSASEALRQKLISIRNKMEPLNRNTPEDRLTDSQMSTNTEYEVDEEDSPQVLAPVSVSYTTTVHQLAEVIDDQNELTKAIAELIRRVHPALKPQTEQAPVSVNIQTEQSETNLIELLATIDSLKEENEALKENINELENKHKRFECGLDQLRLTNQQIVNQLNLKNNSDTAGSKGDTPPSDKPKIEEMRKQLEEFEEQVRDLRNRFDESESLNNRLNIQIGNLKSELQQRDEEIAQLREHHSAVMESRDQDCCNYEETIESLRQNLVDIGAEASSTISTNKQIERIKAKCGLITNKMRDSLVQIDTMERYVADVASGIWNSSEELDRLHENYAQCQDVLLQIMQQNQPNDSTKRDDNPYLQRLENIRNTLNDNMFTIGELKKSSSHLDEEASMWLEKQAIKKHNLKSVLNNAVKSVAEDCLSLDVEDLCDKKVLESPEYEEMQKKYQSLSEDAKTVTKEESDLQYLYDSLKMKSQKLRDSVYEQRFSYSNISKVISVNHYAMEVDDLKQQIVATSEAAKEKSPQKRGGDNLAMSELCAMNDVQPDESERLDQIDKIDTLINENKEMKVKLDELESEKFSLTEKLDSARIKFSSVKCQLEKENSTVQQELEKMSTELKQNRCDLENRSAALDKLSKEYNELVSDKVKLIEDLTRSLDAQNTLKEAVDLKSNEVTELYSVLNEKSEEYANLQNEFLQLTSANQETREMLNSLQEKNEEIKTKVSALIAENENLIKTNQTLESKHQEISASLEQKEKENMSLKESHNQYNETIKNVRAEHDQLRAEIEKRNSDLQLIQSQLKSVTQSKEEMAAYLNAELNRQTVLVEELKKKEENAKSVISSLENELQSEIDICKKWRAKCEVSESSNGEYIAQMNEKSSLIQHLEQKLNFFQSNIEQYEQVKTDLQAKLSESLQKINRLENQVRQLTDLIDSQGSVMPSCVKDVGLLEKKVQECLEELDHRKKLVKELKEKLNSRTSRLEQSLKDNMRLKNIVQDDRKRINELLEEAKTIHSELDARNKKIEELETTLMEMNEVNRDLSAVEQLREASEPFSISYSNSQSNLLPIKKNMKGANCNSSMSIASDCAQCDSVRHLMGHIVNVQMRSKESINETLRAELSILQSQKDVSERTVCGDSAVENVVKPDGTSSAVDDKILAQYMQEFRSLRFNLEEKITENDQLRDLLLTKLGDRSVDSGQFDTGELMENSVKKLQEKLGRTEAHLSDARREILQMKEELKEANMERVDLEKALENEKFAANTLHNQLEATQELINNLKSENNLLRSFHDSVADSRKKQSNRRSYPDANDSFDLNSGQTNSHQHQFDRFLHESKNLRVQLEKAVKSNVDLHEKLEEFRNRKVLHNEGGATNESNPIGGEPCYTIYTPRKQKTSTPKVTGLMGRVFKLKYDKNNSGVDTDQLFLHHNEWETYCDMNCHQIAEDTDSDLSENYQNYRRTLHAVGNLEDFELLKKQVQEAFSILKNLELKLNEQLSYHKLHSPFKNGDYSAYREMHSQVSSLLYYLQYGERLLAGFWTKDLAESVNRDAVCISKDKRIDELTGDIEHLRAKLKRSNERFKSLKECFLEQEKRYEDALMTKLSSTEAILNNAVHNLEQLNDNDNSDQF